MRLVPSLSGGLYKFDGESVEAFPITAESLLSSSVRITDQSIISGGNELRTYGVNPKSGEVFLQANSELNFSKQKFLNPVKYYHIT